MTETQRLRIKSAMIIYEIENSLGNYIIENETDNISDSNKKSIINRENNESRDSFNDNVTFLVESSYLDEIFNMALDVTNGTSLYPHMKEFKNLCGILGIFDIRNAISHPNRPFPDFYWFRSAAIASDPLIEKLNLGSIRQALNHAISENLTSPPDDWYDNVKWAIPNTLPSTFDHEITGLLGRDKEFKDLYSTISKARSNLIAVVAPGGIGKTALILQFLKEVSLSPESSKSINSIVFCTLKNERLTADGIEQIEAIDGVDQIKQSILKDLSELYNCVFSSFDHACNQLENEKILICIDNLETLLLHSQNEFIQFNQSLPLFWRIIVTSRVSVDSAITVSIDPLGKRHAISLCRNYLRKRGVQNIDQETLEKIAETANFNPLAIRLTVDLYNKGVDISESISKSQKDIASFSYRNLIESLKDNSVTILETIYVLNNASKSELIEFLQLTTDEISESINELSKTSLIQRKTNEFGVDSYSLSDSIRDLLLINPKNIAVRNIISEKLKDVKEKILLQQTRDEQQGVTKFDDNYVEPNTDRTTHNLIVDLNKYFHLNKSTKNHSELVSLKTRFDDLINYNTNDYQLFYHYSRILKLLSDKTGELNYLNRSLKISSNSPRIKNAIAKHHFYNGDYEKAVIIFEELIGIGYADINLSCGKFSFSLVKLYFLCLLYLSKYDEILLKTENWKDKGNLSNLYAIYRATTFKRQSENNKLPTEEREKLIISSLSIFDFIFNGKEYPIIACLEVKKILIEWEYISFSNQFSKNLVNEYISFISKHYFNIVSRLRNDSVESKESRDFLSKIYEAKIDSNPLHSAKWFNINSHFVYDEEHIIELENDGYTIIEVYNIPDKGQGLSNYMFGEDINGNQFFLVVSNYEKGWLGWADLEIGSKLAIKYDNISDDSKATFATKIVDIDQYVS